MKLAWDDIQRVPPVWVLVPIVVLALGLRTFDITGSPLGFFCDEASNGLDAYWLIHSLHDQNGAFLPAYFAALGDWRGGFHIYWDVPFVAVFGLDEFAVRLGSAVSGTATIVFTYLFVGRAVNHPVGLITAFLLATSPWHIMMSRVGWEVISLPLVISLGLYCLYRGLEHPRWIPAACACSALGVYTYQPARLFFPLFSVVVLAIYAKPLLQQRKMLVIGLLAAATITIPTILAIFNGTFLTEYQSFDMPSRSVMNFLSTFFGNYTLSFSPSFLVQSSTDWLVRNYVPGAGLIYGFEVPFLIVGVIAMIVQHRRVDMLFLSWFILYPIATAVVGAPIPTRAITGVIVFQIAMAQGTYLTVPGLMGLLPRVSSVRRYSRHITTPDTGQCAACTVVDVYDENGVRAHYRGAQKRLWGALRPDDLTRFATYHIPYHVVDRVTYSAHETAFYIVATVPTAHNSPAS